MAYIARLRTTQFTAPLLNSSAAPLLPSRGDKWYIDPEEVRQYDPPFHVKWGGGWPASWGPNWEHHVMMNKNSMYPRMPYYQRQLKNPYIKYDDGVNGRKNCGETHHILEEWMTPHGQEWHRDNGCGNVPAGILDLILMLGGLWMFFNFMYWLDERYCLQLAAPKLYPFENLWVEQGHNPLVPKEKRPYMFHKIPQVGPDFGMQK